MFLAYMVQNMGLDIYLNLYPKVRAVLGSWYMGQLFEQSYLDTFGLVMGLVSHLVACWPQHCPKLPHVSSALVIFAFISRKK